LIPFRDFPEERELISSMILAYGELECAMLDILGAVRCDMSAAVRTLFQLRSEANRYAVVQATRGRAFDRAGLGKEVSEGMTAVGHCKAYRNQYAHCHWIAEDGVLYFSKLEETAKSKGAECRVKNIPITLPVIKAQWEYFGYADHMLL